MSESPVESGASRARGGWPTLWRTARRLRPAQAVAQLRHALLGLPAPVRLREGVPAQAIAEPATAFLPPPAHVAAEPDGRLELLATPFRLGDPPDWGRTDHGPLFAYHLHQHDYLRVEALAPEQRTGWLLDWIERHTEGVGWDPHPISLRLPCWGKLLLASGRLTLDGEQRDRVLASMADQAETLSRGLEIRLQANHLLSNLVAVVFAGLLLESPASRRWRGLSSRLEREIESQIHPDGGHEERSPMYHALLLESLLDLLNLCRAAPDRAPEGLTGTLSAAAARMARALAFWTHPDHRIALFGDSGFDVAAEPAALFDYARRLGVDAPEADAGGGEAGLLAQTGFVRLAAPDALLLVSSAGPSPPHQPGHAHCDALGFELSLAGRRVVTDSGNFEYRPGPRRDLARSTAAHATLEIDGEEQAELWSAHRVGGRPEVELLAWDGASAAELACRGWSRPNTRHRRRFHVEPGALEIEDHVEGPLDAVCSRLPFDPAWRLELDPDGRGAHGTLADAGDASRLRVELPDALDWSLERRPCFPSFGREVQRDVLVGRGGRCDGLRTRIALGD